MITVDLNLYKDTMFCGNANKAAMETSLKIAIFAHGIQ